MAPSDVGNEGRVGSSPIPIPDLRFEQSYLAGIKPYINIRLSQSEPNKREVTVDWMRVGWLTVRDQVFNPLLQGFIWGMLGQLLRPFVSSLTGRFFSSQPSISSSDSPKRDGKFIEKLREWSKGLAGGVEANVALAK